LHREALDAAMIAFQGSSHLEGASYDAQVKDTRKAKSARRHALEDYERNLKVIQALELKLEIEKRWTPEDTQWQKVGRLVANRKYQRALDRLEGLIVARIFELTKMNRAGTGEVSTVIPCLLVLILILRKGINYGSTSPRHCKLVPSRSDLPSTHITLSPAQCTPHARLSSGKMSWSMCSSQTSIYYVTHV
jgi:hypothetical protein